MNKGIQDRATSYRPVLYNGWVERLRRPLPRSES